MKIKNLKKQIVFYLVTCVLSTLISIYVVDLINKPRNEETITFFVGSYTDGFDDKLKDKLWSNAPSYLKEIEIKDFNLTDSNFAYYYGVIGLEVADVIILPTSKIGDTTVSTYYAELNNNIINEYFSGKDLYMIEDKIYGVKLHNKGDAIDDSSPIIYYDEIENDDDYYAFFRYDSLHINEYKTAFELLEGF